VTAPARVLFLHGFLSGARTWDAVRAELAGDAETWAIDLPAYGRARRLSTTGSLDEAVDSLLPIVGRTRATHLVGHSMGAIVALALAHHLPKTIQAVGLVALPVFASDDDCSAWLRRNDPIRPYLFRRAGLAHAACGVAGRTLPAWRPAAALLARRHPLGHGVNIFDHAECGHGPALSGIVLGGHVPPLATAVSTPAAAIHGAADRTAPIAPAEALARQAGWPMRVIPGARHQLPVTHPRETARWVREAVLASAVDARPTPAPQSAHATD
jgi:pimeloyl-ACP methyl ester carboxylesterase